MSLMLRAVKGSVLLTLGEGLVYGSSFVKNMILARLLTKADFGVAASFSLIILLLELSGKLGITQFLVRDKQGDEPELLATVHTVQVFLAILSSVLIAGCAAPLTSLFGIPDKRGAVILLALLPLIASFEHLDVRRFERQLRFAPSVLLEAIPQVVIALVAWPVAAWLRDYRAVLVLILAKVVIRCMGSHLLAEQPYRWRVHWVYVGSMMRFGWPLVLNSFLVIGVVQGDQFLVAASYSMSDLGAYAAAVGLASTPMFVFVRMFTSVMLPVLAKVQDQPTAFAMRYRQALVLITLVSTLYGLGMILGGEALIRLVYGAKYAGAGVLLACLAAANAFRILRLAPAIAAIARGDTQNQMISNCGRVMGLVSAAGCAMAQQPLWCIASSALMGEAVACWISFLRLRRRDGVPLYSSLVPAAWILLVIGTAGSVAFLGLHQLPVMSSLLLATLGACVGGAATTIAFVDLRSEASRLHGQWRQKGWRTVWAEMRAT